MRSRVTREWRRSTTKRSIARGTRQRRRWPKWAALVVIVIAAFWSGRLLDKKTVQQEDMISSEVPVLDIGGGLDYDAVVQDTLTGKTISVPLNDAIVLDEVVEDEANIAQDTREVVIDSEAKETALSPVGDFHGSGIASYELHEDTGYKHIIVASLIDPPTGYHYEGWLIRSKPFDFFSTGRLIQHADDLKWYLVFEDKAGDNNYKKVVVTLEKDDEDPAPGDHVLEGRF